MNPWCPECAGKSDGSTEAGRGGVRARARALQVKRRGSLLLVVSRMLPPARSPCRMFRSCRYASALAISSEVSLRARPGRPPHHLTMRRRRGARMLPHSLTTLAHTYHPRPHFFTFFSKEIVHNVLMATSVYAIPFNLPIMWCADSRLPARTRQNKQAQAVCRKG